MLLPDVPLWPVLAETAFGSVSIKKFQHCQNKLETFPSHSPPLSPESASAYESPVGSCSCSPTAVVEANDFDTDKNKQVGQQLALLFGSVCVRVCVYLCV